MLSPLKRPIGAPTRWVAASIAVGTGVLLTLTSCGENGGSAQSATTVTIQPTSYVIREPATTTSEPTVNTGDTEGRSPVEQTYLVEPGDYPILIAEIYDISLEELNNYNQWPDDEQYFPQAGETVRIPPNAKFVDQDATETTDEPEDETESTDGEGEEESDGPTTTGGECDAGTYTLEANDYPNGVAEKFDVSLDALNQANATTAGYDVFYVGLEIVIPPPSDC